MKNKFKAHAPILSIVLSLLAVGYSFAANVVVIPLAADNPSGMVSAFNSSECPAGWEKYTNAQGRFVVGLNDGGSIGYAWGAALSNRSYREHDHLWASLSHSTKIWRTLDHSRENVVLIDWGDGIGNTGSGIYPLASDYQDTVGFEEYFTRKASHTPPYVQLLYCEKV